MFRRGTSSAGRGSACAGRGCSSTPAAFLLFILMFGCIGGARAFEHRDENGDLEKRFFLVEMCDLAKMSAGTLQMIRLEVERIYERAGVEIVWSNCRQECRRGIESPLAAAVYILEHLPENLQSSERTLGFVFADGGGLPGAVIYVSRSSIEKFIGRRRSVVPCNLARALGRAIAHELAHRLLKQREHTRDGILRAKFSREALTEPLPKKFYFAIGQMEHLQAHAQSNYELRRRFALALTAQ